MVLSAYSESPQQGEPPDSLDFNSVVVCPNSSSDPLGVLAPVLSQNEMSGSVLSQNRVLAQNEVYKTIVLPQSEVFGSQNVILPQNEVFQIVPPQNGVCKIDCQLSNKFKAIIDFVLNLEVKSFKILTSTLINGGEKLG